MLQILCFSMDRPLQLDGYLRSARRFMAPEPVLSVLFRATTPLLREGYDAVARSHPTVNRVQGYFDNPLLGAARSPEAIELQRREGWTIDLDAFHAQHYDRIHIGDFHLHHPQAAMAAPGIVWRREARIENPALSIIMAAWQAERYLGEAIDSILRQESLPFELIVVDDASTDGTLEVALSFDDPRLTVGSLSKRIAAGAVRNRCIDKTRAPWICVFDADDVMEPHSLAPYFDAVTRASGREWAYCALRLIDAAGADLQVHMRTPYELLRLLQRNIVAHPMALYTRQLFDRAGRYSETLRQSEDYDLWLRFLPFAEPFFHDRLSVRYRRHPNSIGEKERSQPTLLARERLQEHLQPCTASCRAPNARRIEAGLALLDASERSQWRDVLKAGTRLAALDSSGFEVDRRCVDARIALGQPQQALSIAFGWLHRLSAGERLQPYEEVWTLVTCLAILRQVGRRDEITALIPLARHIHDRHHDEALAREIDAASQPDSSGRTTPPTA